MQEKLQPSKAIKVFYSYSHKDEKLRDLLETHLALLKRRRVISSWHDRRIGAGSEWAGEIDEHMKSADIILLLVSANFIASKYCYDIELKLAMKRHRAGEARVIPVILRPCDLMGVPFGKLQSLPKDRQPVTKWPNRDDAFTDIANGIRQAAEALKAKRRAGDATPAKLPEKAQAAGAEKGAASLIPRPPVVGFIARRDEQGRDIVERLKEELAPEKSQLVALWGPGGTGKTTLAAEVVRTTEDVFKGRVAWVSALGRADFNLATLLDEIATQLGHANLSTLAPEPKAMQVGVLIGSHPTLVVLDNFETIAEEEQSRCLDFLTQSAACPALITTRLFISRDDVYNVPLAAMSMEEARDFLQRLVRQTRKPANFDNLDRDDLIAKCEANPLVLQWVVRQIELAKRPRDVLNNLAQGEGDTAKRVFARSFGLPQLGDDGRATLLALSLFTPDASRESLAEVSGFGDDLRRLDKAVEGLSSLWLVETTEGNERLFLRGLTRELAKSHLSKDRRADKLRRRYIMHFLRHAVAHAHPTQENLDALEPEKNNLLGAMDVAFAIQDWESVMRIRIVLENFLFLHGHWDEAVRSGEQAEAAAREAKDDWNVAGFTTCVAMIRMQRGQYEEARRAYREALEVAKRFGSETQVAACLNQLGIIAKDQGDLEEAQKLYHESLDITKKLDDQWGIALTVWNLGNIALFQGNANEAKRLLTEALNTFTNLKDQANTAGVLHSLATLAQNQGETEEARRLYGESLVIAKKLGDLDGIASILGQLGRLAANEGDKTEAARLLREALLIFEKLGSPRAEWAREDLMRVEGKTA